MGVVYLARDVQLDRDVAIKVLPTHLASLSTARERFVQEARTAAGLSHPHIVPIHRVGEVTLPSSVGGESTRVVFFVMSYVEGETLVMGGGAPNAVGLHRARAAGLGGFEFASAIPGTAGGGVRMNAGAYGSDWAAVIRAASSPSATKLRVG